MKAAEGKGSVRKKQVWSRWASDSRSVILGGRAGRGGGRDEWSEWKMDVVN